MAYAFSGKSLRGLAQDIGTTNSIVINAINLDLRNCDLRKNLDIRKIVATTKILAHKLFDLRKFFRPNVRIKKEKFSNLK